MLETPHLKMWKNEGVLWCEFVRNLDMTLEIARACVEARIAFSEGKSYPALIDMTGLRSVTKEAREYMASEGARLIGAGALIVESPVSMMIGNIFLSVNRPPVPTRLFTDKEEAIEWLKGYA